MCSSSFLTIHVMYNQLALVLGIVFALLDLFEDFKTELGHFCFKIRKEMERQNRYRSGEDQSVNHIHELISACAKGITDISCCTLKYKEVSINNFSEIHILSKCNIYSLFRHWYHF